MLSKRTARAYHTHAEEAPAYWMIGVLWRMLATGVQTGGAMCLLDQLCSRGSGPSRHAHRQDEGLYVASGKVSFQAGGQEIIATEGSLVCVPRRTEHSFVVDEDAVLINFYFPAGFDLWLMGSAVPAERNELPPSGFGLPSLELSKTLSDDYDGLPLTQERSTSPNPAAPALPRVASRRTAEAYWYEGGCWSILADAASTGGSYAVFEVELDGDFVVPLHIQEQADVAYYALEGKIELFADDTVHRLRKGSFVFVPRGSVRACRGLSAGARVMVIHTAPGFERLLRQLGTRADGPRLPPPEARQAAAASSTEEIYADLGIRRIAVPAIFAS